MLPADHPLATRVVGTSKIVDYLLNPLHPDGASKARFFLAFGFRRTDPASFAAALQAHPDENPIAEIWSDDWGMHLDVVGPLRTPDGRSPTVLTAWFHGPDGPARLVTAFPA